MPGDPRSVAKNAEAYLKSTCIADTCFVGPEAEFFVFDDVRYDVQMNGAFYELISEEGPYLTGKKMEEGNHGHRPPVKGGYFPVPPIDASADLRAEMLTVMADMGVDVEKHHHEVAPSQHELGIKFNHLVKCADNMQIYKYVVHNVAHSYGKTATFMPKPIKGDNGSGMHVHNSLWKNGQPLFAGNGYADLSEMALYYIGGIIKHAKALNAFTNPLTSRHKRLDPRIRGAGAAGLFLAQPLGLVLHSCMWRAPLGKRVEVRFPGSGATPYLAYSALLMAGLDGIQNKIHPGDPMDKNLYDLPPEELKNVPTVRARCAKRCRRCRPITPSSRRAMSSPLDLDRFIYRAEMGRDLRLRAQPASDRVQDVLLGSEHSRYERPDVPLFPASHPVPDGGLFF